MVSCKDHHHLPRKSKYLLLSIVLNLLVALAQGVVGAVSGSLSLLSDGLHNLSDVISLLISYSAQKLSGRSFTHRETFGFKRAEILAATINAAILIAVAVGISNSAIVRLWQQAPMEIDASWVISMAALGMVVNGLCAFLIRPEDSGNLNLRSAYLHLLADMLTSLAVLVAGIGMYYFIAIFLVYSSWDLLLQTLGVLMQFAPRELSLEAVEQSICRYPEIDNIHHVHCWQLNEKEVHFEAHLDFKKDLPLSEVSRITRDIGKELEEKYGISHSILQAEIGMDHQKDLIVLKCPSPH
jgi:cobalt-zinc-cadmium efflux system protein